MSSSSSQATTNLRQLIQTIRGCKTATEERSVIQRETASIRHVIGNGSPTIKERSRCVLKLAYISMLGYSTEFAQMQVVTLIAENDFVAKRCAYLALAILLDERQEVLTLAENHLKRDLTSGNALIQCLALDAVANLAGEDMAHDVIGDITALLDNTSPSVRRKACLVALRIVQKVPNAAEAVIDKLIACLSERNHGVLISALVALTQCVDFINTTAIVDKLKDRIPVLVTLLKSLILSAYATEYDIGAVADPFLQCGIIRFFQSIVGIIAAAGPEAAGRYQQSIEAITDILAQVATNTDGQRNVGCAILYECVRTIALMKDGLADDGLRVLAVNILGRFVLNKDNNIRYIALSALKDWVVREYPAVQRHRATIIGSLRDPDVSIRRKALELITALINPENVRIIMPDLLDHVGGFSLDMRAEAAAAVGRAIETYAPNVEWRVETSLRYFDRAAHFVPLEFGLNFIALLSRLSNESARPLQRLLVEAVCTLWNVQFLPALSSAHTSVHLSGMPPRESLPASPPHMLKREAALIAAVWAAGEFGREIIIPHFNANPDEGHPYNRNLIISSLLEALTTVYEECDSQLLRLYTLTACAKLVSRCGKFEALANLARPFFDKAAKSMDCEIQQRGIEYLFLCSDRDLALAAFGPNVVAIPEFKENNNNNSQQQGAISLSGLTGASPNSKQEGNKNNNNNNAPKTSFDDIFGGGGSNPSSNASTSNNKNSADIFGPVSNNNNNNNVNNNKPAGGGGGLDDIFGGGGSTTTSSPSPSIVVAAPATLSQPAMKKFEAFTNGDLTVTFNVKQKNPSTGYASLEVEAYVRTSGPTTPNVEDLVFFVSVLKTMQVQLAPALTTNIHSASNRDNGGLGTLVQRFAVDAVGGAAQGGGADVGAVFQARVRVAYAVMGAAKNETFTVNKDLRTI